MSQLSPYLERLADALALVRDSEPVLVRRLPLTLGSAANKREHWAAKAKAAKTQRMAARMALGRMVQLGDLVVRIIRVAPRELDPADNLPRSMKAIIDGVADALLTHDRDPRLTWVCDQARGKAEVVIEFYGEAT